MSAPLEPTAFLHSLSPFSEWEEAELGISDLGARAEVWAFSEGDFIQFPDEAAEGAVWVAEGCLEVHREGEGPVFLGVRERLHAPRGTLVKGKTSGRFVKIPQEAWLSWLRRWPRAAQRLQEDLPAALPRSLTKSPLVLEPGESPRFLFRKSSAFLFLRAATPTAFFLVFVAFGMILQLRFGELVPWWTLWLLPGSGVAVTAFLIALVSWEWSASVLAVTDRSLIFRQIDLWSHRSDFEKMALERVREAIYVKRGWLDAVLHLVTLEVEGDSPRGRLIFRGLSQNSAFLTAMSSLRVQHSPTTLAKTAIRQALAERAGGARVPRLERAAQFAESRKSPVRWSWRTEKTDGIWFRRHPWLAVKHTLPWVGWILLAGFLGVVATGFWPQGWPQIAGVVLLAALFPLGRIVWEIADWADDRLSIQGEKIVMVHRRPFGLGEIRQEGDLDRVEQVGVRKNGLAALLGDFGTVTVSLGASEPLIFEYAHHPEWVQTEIFHCRSLLARSRDTQAAQSRLAEVSEILDTWDQARQAGYFSETPENVKKEES